jgi:hypothetical protein
MLGRVELLRVQGLREYLDSSPGIIKLQSVQLMTRGVSVPFFAIQKSAITFIVPLQHDDHLEATTYAETRRHLVTCWLPSGVIDGHLELPIGVRLSDYLSNHQEFVTLTNCTMRALSGEVVERYAVLLVNAHSLVGISELQNPPAEVFEVVNEASAAGDGAESR